MARHKQPEKLAKLKGADKKNPQRYRTEPPVNKHALGDPPPHMKEKAQEIWYELVQHALPGVITASERFIFEIASNLMAEYRTDPVEFAATKYTHLIGCLGRLGLSPSDRQKLGMPGGKEKENEFEEFG